MEEHDNLRRVCYYKANLFFICYSIDDYNLFKNIQEKWILEIRHCSPGISVVLLGLKSDLRNHENGDVRRHSSSHVSPEEGRQYAMSIGENIEQIGVNG